MVVFDTVDIVLNIYSERHAIQTLFTHYTAETARMVGLAQCLEDLNNHKHKHIVVMQMAYEAEIET